VRHAIYYTPASGSLLHELGSSWLGRDAFTGSPVKQPAIEGLREVTAEPHRYGFHATLKAPFALRRGVRRIDLGDALGALTGDLDAIAGIRLHVQLLDGFIALVPERHDERLSSLAAACVRALDQYREAASEEELRRRRSVGLKPSQEQNLHDWGYPYVLEDFRFHMTLTRRVSEAEARHFLPAAVGHFSAVLRRPVTIDALTVFTQAKPGSDFVAEERFPLRPTLLAQVAS
jgi:putative phosphonate metabolism protein